MKPVVARLTDQDIVDLTAELGRVDEPVDGFIETDGEALGNGYTDGGRSAFARDDLELAGTGAQCGCSREYDCSSESHCAANDQHDSPIFLVVS